MAVGRAGGKMCAPWLCERKTLLPAINLEIIRISFSKSCAVFGSRSNWRLLYIYTVDISIMHTVRRRQILCIIRFYALLEMGCFI